MGSKPRRECLGQVKFLQIRLVSQTVGVSIVFFERISLKLTDLIHIYNSSSTRHAKKYEPGHNDYNNTSRRLHIPNIHLVNWKKESLLK